MKRFKGMNAVPAGIWILTAASYVLPLILDEANGKNELIWFIYLLPSFFFSYYFGLKGRIITALLSTAIHILWESAELFAYRDVYRLSEYTAFRHLGESMERVTVSVGIAVYTDERITKEHLFQIADRALYRAKALRNCSIVGDMHDRTITG